MPRWATSNRAETRWTVRIIPFVIVGALGFATYVVVPHLCVEYLYKQQHKEGVAIALIVLYLVFLLLTIASYLRTFLTVQSNPGFVPLTSEQETTEKERKHKRKRGRDIEARPWVPADTNPDSPGLEAFYSKEIFVCEIDGRPKWCSECRTWKPDRAHHSSDFDRCVRKMDHLCPWVGGVVSETSFNFFAQFTFYCFILCAICIATCAYSFRLQHNENKSLDGRIVAGLALGSLFALFTATMTLTAVRFIGTNITNIDMLRKNQTFRLAVRIPQNTPPSERYQTITYPLTHAPWDQRNGVVNHAQGVSQRATSPVSRRDELAKRTFAILATDPGENPFDLGVWRNCKSVMGDSIFMWLLPIWHSPCCNHDSMESDYEFGPLVEKLKKRYGISDGARVATDGIEMRSA